jgi:fatty acid desaturase
VPVPAVRSELRRIQGGRNAVTCVLALVQTVGVLAAAGWSNTWPGYVAAYLLCGRGFALLLILAHESAHRLLFRNRRLNDAVGRYVLGALGLTPLELYRRAHLTHHRDELGPDEPDTTFYAGYPLPGDSVRRKLLRDALFVSGWKNLWPLVRALRTRAGRRAVWPIWVAQLVLVAATTAAGRWWLWPLLWLGPWMSVWRVLNRLRAIAEHGGMERSPDKRQTTHVVRQTRWARFWMVPYNTGWHLAHHVDMGVPWRALPRLHHELVAAGWIPDRLEHRSYLRLWRAMVR